MGQHNNAEHDQHMRDAAKHSTYSGHDGKANAPRPFHQGSPVGEPELASEGTDRAGEKDAPAPFNQQKGKPFGPKSVTGLSKGKTG